MHIIKCSAVLAFLALSLIACSGANSKAEAEPTSAQSTSGIKLQDSDFFIGKADAKVTIVEYASVTCPHCADFQARIFPTIKEKYVDTGLVKYVFREIPTPPTDRSYVGSVMARCAGEKGGAEAYFLVTDTLLKTQRTWALGADPRGELVKIAAQAGMDEAGFDACIQRQEIYDVINANVKHANDVYQITSTPSFVIDGKKVDVRRFDDLYGALDAALGIESAPASEPAAPQP